MQITSFKEVHDFGPTSHGNEANEDFNAIATVLVVFCI